MRSRVLLLVLLAACGPGRIESPLVTVPTGPDPLEEEDGFTIDPAAPYAKLFKDGATWKLPTAAWIGAGTPPVVTCAISAVQKFPAAMVAALRCTADRELGPVASALPGYGVVATDDGLWITSNAGVIEPPPVTIDELTTLLARHPIRVAVKPEPLHASHVVEQPGTRPIRVETTIDAAPRGDAWCLTDENTAGTETVTSVVCLRAKDGLVGGLAVYRSHGIVLQALAWGDGPPPPPSRPYEIESMEPPAAVTLLHPGKGKRAPLALVAKAGIEQRVEFLIDGRIRGETIAKDAPKPTEQLLPTLTLRGTARVDAVEPDGTFLYRFTLAPLAPPAGSTPDPLAPLDGLVYLAAVRSDGVIERSAVRVERPTPATPALVGQIAQSLAPFTVLPKEPVGVGARWSSMRSPGQVLDRQVQLTVTSRLTERKGGRTVVVSELSFLPFEQPVPRGTAKVDGRGGASMQLADGALVPVRSEEFTLTILVEPADAAAPREKRELLARTRVLPK